MNENKPKTSQKRLVALLLIAGIIVAARYVVPPVHTAVAVRMMPAAAAKTVDPEEDILPIIETKCVKCHGKGKHKGGFQIDTRELLLKGGKTGVVVVVGDSMNSPLIRRVARIPYVKAMPPPGNLDVTDEEVALLRAWIDQGLDWFEEEFAAD